MDTRDRPQRPHRVAAILISAVALLVAACGDTPPPPGPPQAIPVNVIQAQKMTVPIYGEAVGNTLALETVEIRSRVNGHLLERKFADGSLVREKQLLFLIDPDQYEQDLVRAEAQLGYARISLDLARKETQRHATLLRQALISQEEFDLRQIREEEASARHALGTSVFAGMIAATFLGVIFVPFLYALVTGAVEKIRGKKT